MIPFYISEPSTTTEIPNQKPKKRQRKELAKPCGDVADASGKKAKIAKTAGGKVVVPLFPNNFFESLRVSVQTIDYMNVKIQDQAAASGPSPQKKSNDSKTVQDSVLENVKHSAKANLQPRNSTSPKSKAAESSGPLLLKCSNKGTPQQSNSQPNGLAKSTVTRRSENNGTHDLGNATVSKQSVQITVSNFPAILSINKTLAFLNVQKIARRSIEYYRDYSS